jgi:hypothetical protein
MTRQPDMYSPYLARVRSRQGRLFDTNGPPLSALSCVACGRPLERTPGGYLACPRGHGKLLTEAIDDERPPGPWLDDAP